MSDLISRQDAIEALGEKPVGETDWDLGCINQWEWDTEILRTLPSAEPERKKGRWEVQPSTGDDRPFIFWKCSECGNVIYSETERVRRELYAFCGRCGAKMTSGE